MLAIFAVIGTILGGVIGLMTAAVYLFSKFRKISDKAESTSLDTLRKTVDDLQKRVDFLEKDKINKEKTIISQNARISALERINGDITQLITNSLIAYFEAHPDQAIKMAEHVKNSEKKSIYD